MLLAYPSSLPTYQDEVWVELGSTATAYEAYNGTTIPVTWQTEAGTIFGGEVDFVRGKVKATYAEIDMSLLSWRKTAGQGHFYGTTNPTVFPYKFSDSTKMLCSCYKFDGKGTTGNYYGADNTIRYWWTNSASTAREIYVSDNTKWDSMTEAEFIQSITGQKIVYELATPIEYDITPTDIPLLLGNNTIWTDTGDSAMTYLAKKA
jgi:hypothetical protein